MNVTTWSTQIIIITESLLKRLANWIHITEMSESESMATPGESKPYVSYPHPHIYTEQYKPVNTWADTRTALSYAAIFGLLTAATQNAIAKERIGPLSIVTRSGKLWTTIVLTTGAYKFSSGAISNLREKKDTVNEFYAGAIAGAVAGSLSKSMVTAVGYSFFGACVAATVYWSGSLVGKAQQSAYAFRGKGAENNFKPRPSDVVERQGFWDVVRRRPLSQTLEELGEGAFKP